MVEAREEHPVNGAGGSTLRRWREGGWGTCAGPVWNWCQYRQQVPDRQGRSHRHEKGKWVDNPEWESWKWGCYQTLNKRKITSNLLLGDGM